MPWLGQPACAAGDSYGHTGGYFDECAASAYFIDVFSKESLPCSSSPASLHPRGERHKCDIPRLLDRFAQTLLVLGTHAGNAAWGNLPRSETKLMSVFTSL